MKTEVSATRAVLPGAFCTVPTVCRAGDSRFLWVSCLPGPSSRAYSSIGAGLCLGFLEVASVPSHTVQASDLGPALEGSWKGLSSASVGPSRAECDRKGMIFRSSFPSDGANIFKMWQLCPMWI